MLQFQLSHCISLPLTTRRVTVMAAGGRHPTGAPLPRRGGAWHRHAMDDTMVSIEWPLQLTTDHWHTYHVNIGLGAAAAAAWRHVTIATSHRTCTPYWQFTSTAMRFSWISETVIEAKHELIMATEFNNRNVIACTSSISRRVTVLKHGCNL